MCDPRRIPIDEQVLARDIEVFETGEDALELRRIRKRFKFRLDQVAKILGVSVDLYKMYEKGSEKPPVPDMLLMKLLDNHPELLDELLEL